MKNKLLYRLGWLFIFISCLFWVLIVIVPFLSFSAGVKAAVITAFVVLGEIFFWIGALFVGKEVISKYKSNLNPLTWRKKKEND
ncbi:transporter suffix domain-containing protein [Rummeliibacillus pycnus]|uniref:transporter suffix domain-containing protein n=1 Tax=Rummeliibacillus pycnus TaxID=101070 RepID=UPI003D278CE8